MPRINKKVICEFCYNEFKPTNPKEYTCPDCKKLQQKPPKEKMPDECVIVYDPDEIGGMLTGGKITMLEVEESARRGTLAQGFIFRRYHAFYTVKGKEIKPITKGEADNYITFTKGRGKEPEYACDDICFVWK